jgi:protein farnesyltransferase/geranylgeranyltransferase type-1 subunit alpha
MKTFIGEFAAIEQPDIIRSSHALDLLAEVYAEEKAEEQAATALDLLAEKFDPMRVNYWAYRKSLLPQFNATA